MIDEERAAIMQYDGGLTRQQAEGHAMTTENKELLDLTAIYATEVFAPGGVEKILQEVKKKSHIENPDITTEKGRSEIISTAYQIARSKTGLDALGKELVEDQKRKTALIDAERKKLRDGLDALKDEVRKPVTDWENTEKDRIAGHQGRMQNMRELLNFDYVPKSGDITERLQKIEDMNTHNFQEFQTQYETIRETVQNRLSERLAEQIKIEAESEELEALRAEKIKRDEMDRAATQQREADERANLRVTQEQEAAAKAEKDRAANVEHRRKINNAAVERLSEIVRVHLESGNTDELPKAIIGAIARDQVPNVKISY